MTAPSRPKPRAQQACTVACSRQCPCQLLPHPDSGSRCSWLLRLKIVGRGRCGRCLLGTAFMCIERRQRKAAAAAAAEGGDGSRAGADPSTQQLDARIASPAASARAPHRLASRSSCSSRLSPLLPWSAAGAGAAVACIPTASSAAAFKLQAPVQAVR